MTLWTRIRVTEKLDLHPNLRQNSGVLEAQNRRIMDRSQMEAMRLQLEQWRVCRPVVSDSHHFEEDSEPDPL
jgi:hypothetical protein